MATGEGRDRPYPTGADYSEALRDTTLCFAHPSLARGMVAMGPLRMPRAVSGNFGSVFRVTSTGPSTGQSSEQSTGRSTESAGRGGREYAVKCFTRAVSGRLRRYRAISEALRAARGTWRVEAEYVPRGVLVHGHWYPVILMEWVEGTALIPWLEDHLGDPAAIDGLARRFADVVGELEDAGFAHGDLQHGNIVIGRDGGLRLIDYDGMYVPALAGLPAAEHGHRNYQHPDRGTRDFGPGLDRFSAHVIHLTLRVLARAPWLWTVYHEDGGEHLLLKAEDFTAPRQSDRFTAISCAEPELTDEFARLAHWATRPIHEVAALGDPVRPTAAAAGGAVPGPTGSGHSGGGHIGGGHAGTLPQWLADAAGLTSPDGDVPAGYESADAVLERIAKALADLRDQKARQTSPANPPEPLDPPTPTDPAAKAIRRVVRQRTSGAGQSGGAGHVGGTTPAGHAGPASARPGVRPTSGGSGGSAVPSSGNTSGSIPGATPSGSASARTAAATGPAVAAAARSAPRAQPSTRRSVRLTSFVKIDRRLVRDVWVRVLSLVVLVAAGSAACVRAVARSGARDVFVVAAVAAVACALPVGRSSYRRLAYGYLHRPEPLMRESAVEECDQAAEALHVARSDVVRREDVVRDLRRERGELAAQQRADSAGLHSRYEFERAAVEKRLAETLASVDQRRTLLDGSGAREELQALRALQERGLRDGLTRAPLPVELLGTRLVAVLDGEGIRTAADFTRVTSAVPTSPSRRAQAVLSRPGRTVRVDGLSPALARELQEWRDEIVEEIRIRLPATLPYREAQDLHRKRAERRLDLARQAARARNSALADLAALDTGVEAAEARMALDADSASARADGKLRDALDALADAEADAASAAARLAAARDEVEAYAPLTYRRFVLDVLLGR